MSEKKMDRKIRLLEIELFYYIARMAELDKEIQDLDALRSDYYYRSRELQEKITNTPAGEGGKECS